MSFYNLHNFLIVLIISLFIVSCNNSDNENLVHRKTMSMGTIMEFKVSGVPDSIGNKAITEAIREIEKLNVLYSTYKEDNYIWSINHPKLDTITVTPETYNLLNICDTAYVITQGSFDAAIGNFIELLGLEKEKQDIPDENAIQKTLEKVGWKHIKLLPNNILKKPKDVKVSFNAILPGYAADKAVNILKKYGITEYLVNTGGEVFGSGKDWKVGIQHPRKRNELMGTLEINNMGVSTSGDYERYFKKDGVRFSHIINPLTGYPVNVCEAVTIIAPTTVEADYLSTGIFVMGPERGMKLIESLNNVEGIIVDTAGVIYESSGLKKYFRR